MGVSGLLEEAPRLSNNDLAMNSMKRRHVLEKVVDQGWRPSDHLFQWFGDDHTVGPRAGYRQRPLVSCSTRMGVAVMASESIRENDDVEKESIPELISRLVLHGWRLCSGG